MKIYNYQNFINESFNATECAWDIINKIDPNPVSLLETIDDYLIEYVGKGIQRIISFCLDQNTKHSAIDLLTIDKSSDKPHLKITSPEMWEKIMKSRKWTSYEVRLYNSGSNETEAEFLEKSDLINNAIKEVVRRLSVTYNVNIVECYDSYDEGRWEKSTPDLFGQCLAKNVIIIIKINNK